MGMLTKVTVLVFAIFVGYLYNKLNAVPPVPKLESKWWGPGQPQKVNEAIRPFKINISKQAVDDFKQRLRNVPEFTPPLEGIGFEYGFNSKYLRELVQYWLDKYNWRQREVYLNSLPQFKTYVDGLDIHFIHVKPKNVPTTTRVLPLLLLHGWPGSVREFYDVIPLLTTPRAGVDFVFEVVVPSLPGFGFSEGAAKPGMGPSQMAVVMKDLMKKLGYNKFYAQGGDWGSYVVSALAILYKDDVLGIHLNMCVSDSLKSNFKWLLGSLWPTLIVEQQYVNRMYPISEKLAFIVLETGYFHIQATKPDTVAVALRDSPAGLAAYILEKVSTLVNPDFRSRPDGGLTVKFKLDDLLDNIMIYWFTGSITTSVRIYSEYLTTENQALGIDTVLGIHLNACVSNSLKSNIKWLLGSLWPTLIVDKEYVNRMYPISEKLEFIILETGYFHIQATKPDTVAVALRDSPAGLAAYILEKVSTLINPDFRSRPDGGLTVKFKLDDLLDNIMLYWFTGSITTSVRIYSEYLTTENQAMGIDTIPVEVPTACAMFPYEVSYRPPFILKDKYKDLVQFTNMPRGGHFAAFEEPQLFAEDVWSAVKVMQQRTT